MSPRRKGGIRGGVHQTLAHESARKHVSGEAVYIDDMPEPPGLLHAAFGLSQRAHARISKLDLAPVRRAPGVVALMAAADPGKLSNLQQYLKGRIPGLIEIELHHSDLDMDKN